MFGSGTLLFLVVVVLFILWAVYYVKSFRSGQKKRQEQAEVYLKMHSGQRILSWEGPRSPGEADRDFGALVLNIPAKLGSPALFYERGFVLGNKRVSYEDIKDIVVECDSGNAKLSLKQVLRDGAKLWIYRNHGTTVGLNSLSHQLDSDTMFAIQHGLGFGA